MMRNEPYFRTQRILRRQPLHASCSAMRSTDDTLWRMQSKNHLHHAVRLGACAWCDASGSQSSVSQMNLLLHGSVWLQTMVSNRSISCRDFESMRINECVVKRRTVQSINKPSYIVHCSFVLFVLSYCALFYSYDPDFLKQWVDSWDDHHHVLRTPYKYDVVCLYAHERTRRTHKMSCGMN